MKKYIFLGALGALALGSCTSMDVDVESEYTEYPNNEIAIEAKMTGVYYHLRGTLGRRYMEAQALSSDEWVGYCYGSDNYYDAGTYAHATVHNYSPDDATIDWFEDVTSGITKANAVIASIGGEHAGASAAGARAIRAYYHWVLMDCYGDTPILDKEPEEGAVILRQPRAKVAQFIADELEEIIPQLTEDVTTNTYGKPTRWMAEALLAKVYINWPVYTAESVDKYDAASYSNPKLQRVIELCEDIQKSGKFALAGGEQNGNGGTPLNPYRAKFYPNNGPQIKDFIYAMPFNAADKDGMQYQRPRTWKNANKDVSYYGTTLSKSCGGNFAITPEMADLFTLEGDNRNEVIIGGQIYLFDPVTYEKTETPWSCSGTPVVLTKEIPLVDNELLAVENNVNGYSRGYKSVKYFLIDEDYKNDRCQSNDLPIFRYADILLLKAEAILRGAHATNGDTPASLMNEVRSYAKAPAVTGTPSLSDLLAERGRELFDENWRRNDMIRFGTFESEYGFHRHDIPGARFEKTCRIFPIPTSVLNKNPEWEQNKGY